MSKESPDTQFTDVMAPNFSKFDREDVPSSNTLRWFPSLSIHVDCILSNQYPIQEHIDSDQDIQPINRQDKFGEDFFYRASLQRIENKESGRKRIEKGRMMIGEGIEKYWEGLSLIVKTVLDYPKQENFQSLFDVLELGLLENTLEGEIHTTQTNLVDELKRFIQAEDEQLIHIHAGRLLFILRKQLQQ